MFESLLNSMLQCICDLWDAADSPEKEKLLIKRLEGLVERLKLLQASSDAASAGTVALAETQAPDGFLNISSQAREMLAVILSASGLLEKYELKLPPERKAEEFSKIRDAIQSFARLLDEAAI